MCEAYVYVFGRSNVSSWPVLVCQSDFFNFLVLVVVGRVISFFVLPFGLSSFFGGETVATNFLRSSWLRSGATNGISLVFLLVVWVSPRHLRYIYFIAHGTYALFIGSAPLCEESDRLLVQSLEQ